MRKILFRGKRIDNGEWVYGSLIDGIYGAVPAIVTLPSVDDDFKLDFEYDHVDPSTVGQYTGLTDKNGKRIFEGDVCQTKGIPLIDEKPFVAVWNDYYSGFYWENIDNPRETDMFTQTVAELTEVIGNIHDNPELLKEG